MLPGDKWQGDWTRPRTQVVLSNSGPERVQRELRKTLEEQLITYCLITAISLQTAEELESTFHDWLDVYSSSLPDQIAK